MVMALFPQLGAGWLSGPCGLDVLAQVAALCSKELEGSEAMGIADPVLAAGPEPLAADPSSAPIAAAVARDSVRMFGQAGSASSEPEDHNSLQPGSPEALASKPAPLHEHLELSGDDAADRTAGAGGAASRKRARSHGDHIGFGAEGICPEMDDAMPMVKHQCRMPSVHEGMEAVEPGRGTKSVDESMACLAASGADGQRAVAVADDEWADASVGGESEEPAVMTAEEVQQVRAAIFPLFIMCDHDIMITLFLFSTWCRLWEVRL